MIHDTYRDGDGHPRCTCGWAPGGLWFDSRSAYLAELRHLAAVGVLPAAGPREERTWQLATVTA